MRWYEYGTIDEVAAAEELVQQVQEASRAYATLRWQREFQRLQWKKLWAPFASMEFSREIRRIENDLRSVKEEIESTERR